MKGARAGEFATIRRLAALFGAGRAPGILTGIGDDAAVLEAPAGERLVFTIDEQVEGVHFTRAFVGWIDLGWRSFMAAASDVAAMGAAPWCALSALSLPEGVTDADVDAVARGQQDAAERIGASIVGGNVTRGEAVTVTTAVLGTTERAVLRRGARAGDGIWVAGPLGLAGAGFAALRRGLTGADVEPAIAAWRRPIARHADAAALSAAHAAIDVSDGLAQDVGHVASASGVRAVLDEAALRAHAEATGLAAAARRLGCDPLELVLSGGEDYALVAASDAPLPGFWRAGTFTDADASGDVALATPSGAIAPVAARGFDHLARGGS